MAQSDEDLVEELASIFHQEYQKVFIAASWQHVGSEYRRAVLMGARAIRDHLDGNPRSARIRQSMAIHKSSDATN